MRARMRACWDATRSPRLSRDGTFPDGAAGEGSTGLGRTCAGLLEKTRRRTVQSWARNLRERLQTCGTGACQTKGAPRPLCYVASNGGLLWPLMCVFAGYVCISTYVYVYIYV